MLLLKFIAIIWTILMGITFAGLIIGYFIENKVDEEKPLKKWWRKHISAPDPYDENNWKNFKD